MNEPWSLLSVLYQSSLKENFYSFCELNRPNSLCSFLACIKTWRLTFHLQHRKVKASSYCNYCLKHYHSCKSEEILWRITIPWKCLANDGLFHCLGYKGSWQGPKLPQQKVKYPGLNKSTRSKKVAAQNSWSARHVLVEVWFSRWSWYAYFECLTKLWSYCTYSYPLPNATYPKSIKWNSNKQVGLVLKTSYLSTYRKVYQHSSLPQVPNLPMEQWCTLQNSIPGYPLSFKILLPNKYAVISDRRSAEMSSTCCSGWLQTRLLVQFVAVMAIGSHQIFVFHIQYRTTVQSANIGSFYNAWGRKYCNPISIWKMKFTSQSSVNGVSNKLYRILAMSTIVSWQK